MHYRNVWFSYRLYKKLIAVFGDKSQVTLHWVEQHLLELLYLCIRNGSGNITERGGWWQQGVFGQVLIRAPLPPCDVLVLSLLDWWDRRNVDTRCHMCSTLSWILRLLEGDHVPDFDNTLTLSHVLPAPCLKLTQYISYKHSKVSTFAKSVLKWDFERPNLKTETTFSRQHPQHPPKCKKATFQAIASTQWQEQCWC